MLALSITALIILLLYIIKISRFHYYWAKHREFLPETYDYQVAMSVVIAFRNEAANLELLLKALEKQVYPQKLYEVVLVDDDSDDGSDHLVKYYCEKNRSFRYISNTGNHHGKKTAIKTGIRNATHEIIVTTDADCIMSAYWLATIARFFQEYHPDLVIGLVDIDSGTRFFERFEEADFLSLIASGAAAVAEGHPIYCNAANMAFRKSLFFITDDPLHDAIISGDDTFFLHAVKKHNKKIMLLKSTHSVITTKGHTSFSEFLHQRLRWVSKSRYYRDADTIYTATVVLLMNMAILYSMVLLISGKNHLLFPFLFIAKFITDYLFLRRFMKFLTKNLSISRFLLYALIYPASVVFFGLTGLFSGYTWKGRHFKQ